VGRSSTNRNESRSADKVTLGNKTTEKGRKESDDFIEDIVVPTRSYFEGGSDDDNDEKANGSHDGGGGGGRGLFEPETPDMKKSNDQQSFVVIDVKRRVTSSTRSINGFPSSSDIVSESLTPSQTFQYFTKAFL